MSLLEQPQAQALLADAVVRPAAVRGCQEHLTQFLRRYLPLFYRNEQRDLATLVIQGRLSGLERKTSEPIAHQAGHTRKPVQHFVGAGAWDDEAVMAELRGHVAEELGDPAGVLVVDSSGFPKKGTASCGVARQWCGRLGKLDNCQVGVFLSYAAPGGHAPLDRRLFLTQDWAADRKRRRQTHVPREVIFQEKWRIGLDLLDRSGPVVPHGWVVGDDEFGRATEFRAQLRWRHERYVLDVPANTLVREVAERPGGRRPPFEQAEGKGEVGLAHYGVRGWVGWHHHMTLALLALWFLTLERRRLGGENPGLNAAAGTADLQPAAARPAAQPGADRGAGQPRAAA